MKDQFNNLINKKINLIEQQDDSHLANIDVDIYFINAEDHGMQELDWPSTLKTYVKFRIDIETRSWGIKGITVTPINIQPIQFELTREDGTVVKTYNIQIDHTKILPERVEPIKYIGIGDIKLYLNKEGVVDYNTSSIEVHEI